MTKNQQGGKREGAGRKKKFNAPTKVLRVPETMVDQILDYIQNGDEKAFPLYASKVQAGFPSPADDYIECKLDLNDHLIKHPAATFFARATGNSMIKAGIFDGDLLIVDRSLEAKNGKIVIAAIDGELTVKRYKVNKGEAFLMPENDAFPPIKLSEENDIHLWGVVTNVIHNLE